MHHKTSNTKKNRPNNITHVCSAKLAVPPLLWKERTIPNMNVNFFKDDKTVDRHLFSAICILSLFVWCCRYLYMIEAPRQFFLSSSAAAVWFFAFQWPYSLKYTSCTCTVRITYNTLSIHVLAPRTSMILDILRYSSPTETFLPQYHTVP